LAASGCTPRRRARFTRNGLDWTKRFSAIAGAFDIPGQAIVDGEVVVIKDRRTNFSELQAELAGGRQSRLAFDLLYLDGYDLRAVAQIERKRLLKELFERYELELPVRYSEHLTGDGQEMFA
jgi:bifunctional non-homologous end joining protein LigD